MCYGFVGWFLFWVVGGVSRVAGDIDRVVDEDVSGDCDYLVAVLAVFLNEGMGW